MKQLRDRVAVVTGAGGGIGRGISLALAASGMKLALADVELDALPRVRAEVEALGVEAAEFETDVSDRAAVEQLARGAFERFGAVHLLCNNAGVTTFGPLDACTDSDWAWVLDVNLHGVANGLQAFLPRMRQQPGEKHVVNTASMAGMLPYPWLGPYVASKFAVVGLTETLRAEGAAFGLSASVLCPGNVRTGIVHSGRNRPAHRGGRSTDVHEGLARSIEAGIDPLRVGRMVRDAVVRDDLYIFTHPELRAAVAARFDRILASFDDAAERARSEEAAS